jgi:prepilin-type N-terminal cleavage/methylation domain-containing protein
MKKTAVLSRGFTLIELLIVIALLGALAIGLLATIDPFEQLKKGRDTSMRNTVSEIYNANLRYYSTKGTFPWGTGQIATQSMGDAGMVTYVSDLIAKGELKSRFVELVGTANLAKIFITSTSAVGTTPEYLSVCYSPESKGFQADPATTYASDGFAISDNTCKSGTGQTAVNNCYFCIQ